MSFFEKAAKAASAFGEAVEEQKRKQREMVERLESKSDEQLKKIIQSEGFFGSSDTQKAIARRIMRDRGY